MNKYLYLTFLIIAGIIAFLSWWLNPKNALNYIDIKKDYSHFINSTAGGTLSGDIEKHKVGEGKYETYQPSRDNRPEWIKKIIE